MSTLTQHSPKHEFGIENHAHVQFPPQTPPDELPSQSAIDSCASLSVCDSKGKSVSFSSLYKVNGSFRRTLIVFVRHFYCGLCQEYLRALSSSFTSEKLASLEFPTDIKIIGCGSPDLVAEYASRCQCSFPIYADHTRKLYDVLGMTSTLELGSKPDYQSNNMVNIVGSSLVQVLGSGMGFFKGGSYNQVGGELLFQDGKLVWCHRMRTTRDHTEIEDLRKILGLS